MLVMRVMDKINIFVYVRDLDPWSGEIRKNHLLAYKLDLVDMNGRFLVSIRMGG